MPDSSRSVTGSDNLPIPPRQLELAFEEAVHVATDHPATADIRSLWQLAEQLLNKLTYQDDYQGQLALSGNAIAQIVDIFALRAESLLQQLEPASITGDGDTGEPVLFDDLLQGLIRQTMALNLEEITSPTPLFERQSSLREEEESMSGTIEKDALLQWLEQYAEKGDRHHPLHVAHEENISGWATQVRHCVATNPQQPIQLRDLADRLQWGIVQLWITLLLGNLECQWDREPIEGIQKAEAFYCWDWSVTITSREGLEGG